MTDADAVPELSRWQRTMVSDGTLAVECLERGDGPGVILLPEIPGIMPGTIELGDLLVDHGFTVVMPSLFGVPGRRPGLLGQVAAVAKLCVMAEFRAFSLDLRGQVTDFLRLVAGDLAARTHGRGVGIVGMCFTGGFAIATAVTTDEILVTVVSQPAAPFPVSPSRARSVGVPPAALERYAASRADATPCVLGLRFTQDARSGDARMVALERHLGRAARVVRIPSGDDSADGTPKGAHSVLTGGVREDPPNRAFLEREQMFEFLRERLAPAGASDARA
ncbi:dienelactone hydrolase family protein [Agromyces cerinus]|uniref:Dienelactone hydrolase family protein n=1 Tax=Agromyces cerinus subsp. cerinus TaxID=232089 RepID=A0A1N6GTI5_9MICO|nr:dienelactone hydrolase family protein [Agromyces cerinus]SIO10839.1 Dienelactone hydrolase family protein [Agromyces cerinus subsp. cerinus]